MNKINKIKFPIWNNSLFNKKSLDISDIEILGNSYIFKNLNKRELQRVYTIVHNRKYKKNDYIFEEGYPGAALFIIKDGEVIIEKNGEKIDELSNGAFLGEIFLLSDMLRSFSAKCKTDVEVLTFFCEDLIEFSKLESNIGIKIMMNIGEVLTVKLIETNKLLEQKFLNFGEQK